jgi:hypothetical protein
MNASLVRKLIQAPGQKMIETAFSDKDSILISFES